MLKYWSGFFLKATDYNLKETFDIIKPGTKKKKNQPMDIRLKRSIYHFDLFN